jgi:predicted thioesterase
MDDIIGWCAMFVTGACHPWSGYTVQVNTALRRPIPVGTFLLAKATIVSVERRKVSIKAVILDPDMDSLHAEGEGLVVMNKGVLP